MAKTTKNNPAAFQKIRPKTLLMIIKKTIKKIFSGQFSTAKNLITAELLNYFSQYRTKNQFYCNLCKKESPYFFHTANKIRILRNSICPNCSSRKRHRGLYEIYKNILGKMNSPKILHFAPEPVYFKLFKSYDYITADIELSDVDIRLDIENIDYQSDPFDLILCNHVLEHVENDKLALIELKRILNPSGCLILTIPGNWRRIETIEYDHPDSNGHYRDYGLNFLPVLKDIFSRIESIDLFKYNFFYNLPLGLTNKHDFVFLCHKD